MNMFNKSMKSRRRLFRITDKEFQVSFLVFTFMIGFLATVTSVLGMVFITSTFSKTMILIPELNWNQINELIEDKVNLAWILIAIITLVNLLSTALLSFFFSQRISGILFRVNKVLKSWMAGESVAQIEPRQGDFFEDLVQTTNQITQRVPGPVSGRNARETE